LRSALDAATLYDAAGTRYALAARALALRSVMSVVDSFHQQEKTGSREATPRCRARACWSVLFVLWRGKSAIEHGGSFSCVRLRKRFGMGAHRNLYCFLAQLGTWPFPVSPLVSTSALLLSDSLYFWHSIDWLGSSWNTGRFVES